MTALESMELEERNTRPDLFALADDMAEAELFRTGKLSFDAPASDAGVVSGWMRSAAA